MKQLNQKQINYLLDTFFEDEYDVYKITYMWKEQAAKQQFEVREGYSIWVELYMNGRHITDINNKTYSKEYKKMMRMKGE